LSGRTPSPLDSAASASAPPAYQLPERRWAPGCKVGPYKVLAWLGAGSFGFAVLARRRAQDGQFQKRVVLKIMKANIAQDPEFALRMRDEAKLQASLRHDQLVDVYDFRQVGSELVLEMEYVEGVSLHEFLVHQEPTLPISTIAFLVSRVLRGLAFVHEAQDDAGCALHLVHRDVKPANIFLSRAGALKLGDFGLVYGRGRQFDTEACHEPRVLGTPRYMAPEQCRSSEVNGRTDVYAVGVMLYGLLSGGKHPAGHETIPNELYALAATMRPQRTSILVHCPLLPRSFAALVDAMVDYSPAARPEAADALLALLDTCPFDSAREELWLAQAVTHVMRSGAGEAVRPPSTAADHPTECIMREGHEPAARNVAQPPEPHVQTMPLVVRPKRLGQGDRPGLFGAIARLLLALRSALQRRLPWPRARSKQRKGRPDRKRKAELPTRTQLRTQPAPLSSALPRRRR